MHTRTNSGRRSETNTDTTVDLVPRSTNGIVDRIRERPIAWLGVAAGAGFVLGGGLATPPALRLLRKSLGLAIEWMIVPLLVSQLQSAVTRESDDHRGRA